MALFPAVMLLGGIWYHRNEDGIVQQVTKEAADTFIEAGVPIIESVVELAEGALDLIRGAGVAVLDATNATYTLAASIVEPRRVEAVAVGWAMLIYTLTAFTIFNKMKEN
jgi:hypothetical protein